MEKMPVLLLAGIFAVIVMLLFPAQHTFQRQDELVEEKVELETTKLVDSIRTKGYISADMLNRFHSQIGLSNYLFKVEIIHEKKIYVPVYSDPNNPNTYTGDYEIHYENSYTKEINDYIYDKKKRYELSADDFITIRVQNMVRTNASILKDVLTFNFTDDTPEIFVQYGGMILNEAR
ncbi:hypothetical protein [Lysinibacillus sphaericus]|uniref:Uncharacterized protein n=1 Tax=Lysinibacillus sphaericus TaxID=1421 RepID=A0A6G9ZZL8_LYSSH|nr:hypothetical protein [Lysinibacillus sphaericus]QIS31161.1 hypothetical protein [Lysinibacillus sphaericus]QPA61289.1 hypothetical protein INQ55_23430 [Lysinibacillus sphaericus]